MQSIFSLTFLTTYLSKLKLTKIHIHHNSEISSERELSQFLLYTVILCIKLYSTIHSLVLLLLIISSTTMMKRTGDKTLPCLTFLNIWTFSDFCHLCALCSYICCTFPFPSPLILWKNLSCVTLATFPVCLYYNMPFNINKSQTCLCQIPIFSC
jgi:hypothetical protein